MCFGDKNDPIDLSKEKFEVVKIKFNSKEKIEFDPKNTKWNPFITDNTSKNTEVKKSKNIHDQGDIEQLQKEIEDKDKKISDLQTKIETVEKKIETLKNILKIDVGEQLYLQDLLKDKNKLENNS